MAAVSDVIMLLLLLWNQIKQQVVSINWKYKERSFYLPNILSIKWMALKVEGRGPIDPPPLLYAFV